VCVRETGECERETGESVRGRVHPGAAVGACGRECLCDRVCARENERERVCERERESGAAVGACTTSQFKNNYFAEM